MKELFSAYKLPIIFGGLGVLLAFFWLTFGFFKKLLIIFLTEFGAVFVFFLKKTVIVVKFFK